MGSQRREFKENTMRNLTKIGSKFSHVPDVSLKNATLPLEKTLSDGSMKMPEVDYKMSETDSKMPEVQYKAAVHSNKKRVSLDGQVKTITFKDSTDFRDSSASAHVKSSKCLTYRRDTL